MNFSRDINKPISRANGNLTKEMVMVKWIGQTRVVLKAIGLMIIDKRVG